MGAVSFSLPGPDGYRYSAAMRCRRGEATGWYLQRWNGTGWTTVANGLPTYSAVRQEAARWEGARGRYEAAYEAAAADLNP
jgi:hypothetical protein